MTRRNVDSDDLGFVQALIKRGFVNMPRLLIDYTADLGLDYDTIGRLYALMACLGGPAENAFETYRYTRKKNPADFDQIRLLLEDLEQKELVRAEINAQELSFSFAPMYFRLRAIWGIYKEQHEVESPEATVHPAVAAAEKLLGRTFSDRDVQEILHWVSEYGYENEMVLAICREGLNQGVTRMSYLSQIARRWSEDGIRSPEEAEVHMLRHRKSVGRHKAIVQYLGIKHNLTAAEQALLDKWTDDWGFSNEVIIRACMEATGSKNPMQYINRVLEAWYEQGIRTVADADRLISEHKRRASTDSGSGSSARARRSQNGARSNVFLTRDQAEDRDIPPKRTDR